MTSLFSVDRFKGQFTKVGGLSKGHLFRCSVGVPPFFLTGYPAVAESFVLCKSTTVPTYTIGTASVHYMTREFLLPSSRSHSNFTAVFYNSNDYAMFNFFTAWQNLLSDTSTNKKATSTDRLLSNIVLEHYSQESTGNPFLENLPLVKFFTNGKATKIATYTLIDAFPVSVSGLSFGQDEADAFQTYSIEFAYGHFTHVSDKQLSFTA